MKSTLTILTALLLTSAPSIAGEATAEFNFPGFGDVSILAGPVEIAANDAFADEGLDVTVEVTAKGDETLLAEYTFDDDAGSCADIEANLTNVNASLGGIGTAKLLSCSDDGGGNNSEPKQNLLGSEIEAGTDWFWSDWLSAYYSTNFPWIWTVEHGWWWVNGSDDQEIYAYSLERGAWLYTGDGIYPWVYDLSQQEWVDLSEG